jgi:hypothetical protein
VSPAEQTTYIHNPVSLSEGALGENKMGFQDYGKTTKVTGSGVMLKERDENGTVE